MVECAPLLEQFQGIASFWVAVMLVAGIWALLDVGAAGKPKAPVYEFCKLHQRPLADCPRGSHPQDQ